MKNINIPYLFIDKKCSKEAFVIKCNITSMLDIKNIPYILEEDSSYTLCINKNKYFLKNIEEVMYLSKICVVIEAGYNDKSRYLIDKFLDSGLDILCFPYGISNEYSKFSNNLIRDGAICITSYHMLLEYLST